LKAEHRNKRGQATFIQNKIRIQQKVGNT